MAFTAPDEELEKPPVKGGFSAPATDSPTGGFSAPKEDVAAHVQSLTDDSTFDPAAHAAQNPADFDTAFAVDQARKNRGAGANIAEGVKAVPHGIVEGVKGVGKLIGGLGLTAFDTTRQGIDSAIAAGANAVGADDVSADFGRKATQLKAENILAAQSNEENLRNIGRIIQQHHVPTSVSPSVAAMEHLLIPETDARTDFQTRVEHARRQQQLATGTPLDTGVVAALARMGSDTKISETYGPQGLKAVGAEPVRPLATEMKTAASDPMNLVLTAAPGLPGSAQVAGRLTQAAGKLAQFPMDLAEAGAGALKHVGPAGKAVSALAGGGVGAGTVLAAAHAPMVAAGAAGVAGLAKIGQLIGRAAEAQGKELATGLPSKYSTEVANAAATGKSAIGANIARQTGDILAHGAQTATAMAPLNLALSEGDPKHFAELESGAATFGGAIRGFSRNRPMLVEAIRPHLRSEGAWALHEAANGNDPLATRSQEYLNTLPEEARNRTLEAIGALQGLPVTAKGVPTRAKVYVLSEPDYMAVQQQAMGGQQAAMGGGRGFFMGDDGAAYINGDYHSGLPASELAHTIGHEFGGHAAINVMRAAGAKGGALYNGLMGAARDALMPNDQPTPEFQQFVDAYNHAFDPSGQTQRLNAGDQSSIDEFISETAGKIMANRGAGELAIPQNIQDKISQGIGRFMGGMLGMDTRKIGGETNFGRKEVGAVTQAVQDTLGQIVGMKLRGGAEIPEPAKTTETRTAELQRALAKPRPAPTQPVEEMRAWVKEQAQARKELADLTGGQNTAFPASGAPPESPSKPGLIVSPDSITADAVRAAMQFGIPNATRASAAIRQANAQHGEPILDPAKLALAAYRVFKGGTVKPGEFNAKPVETTPVPVPTGEQAKFRDETGAERIITGQSHEAPRVGDIVATREGELRRVTRTLGDTIDTARPIDPLNARGTKTHKIADVTPLTHDYAPERETPPATTQPPPLGATPVPEGAGTPTATTPQVSQPQGSSVAIGEAPSLSVQPGPAGSFVIKDAAGKTVKGKTYATEVDAQKALSRMGKKSTFGLPPSANGDDILDSIMEHGGIHLGGMSKEEAENVFPHKGAWRNALTTDSRDNTPDEVARNLAGDGKGDGDSRTMFRLIDEAIQARNSLRDQQASEEKRQKTEGKQATTQERAKARLVASEAEQAATAAEKDSTPAAAQGRIKAAKIDAIVNAMGEGTGLERVTQDDGSTAIKGKFDPSNLYHQELRKVGGVEFTPEQEQGLETLQSSEKPMYIRYFSAPTAAAGEGGEGSAPEIADQGKRVYNESKGRTQGVPQHKVATHISTTITKGGDVVENHFVPNNLLHNLAVIFEHLKGIGRPNPYGETINEQQPQMVADAKAYAENHAHGFKGDGSGPIKQFPDSNLPHPDPSYTPTVIPKERFDVLNLAFHSDKAGGLAKRTGEVADKQARVEAAKTPRQKEAAQRVLSNAVAKMQSAEQLSHLAEENNRWVDHASGETNQLRAELQAGGFDTGKMKSPFETLRPENILQVSETPIPLKEGDIPEVRPSGFDVDPAEIVRSGRPNDRAVAAGFLPDTAGAENASPSVKERAAKLWAEKGTESPFFKKWFGGSKVVKNDGSPMLLFTGQPRNLTEIPETTRSELPFAHSFLSTDRSVAGKYSGASERSGNTDFSTGRKGRTYRVYAKIENPIDLDAPLDVEAWKKLLAPPEEVESKMQDGISRKKAEREVLAEALGLEEYWPEAYADEPSIMEGYTLRDSGATFPKNFDLEDVIKAKWRAISGHGFHLQFALNDSPTGQAFALFPEHGESIATGGNHDGYIHTDTENGGKTWIPFDSEQIKSATHNQGTFDESNPDIRFMPSAKERAQERVAARKAQFMPTETMRDDMATQAGWLNQEALSRGYKSTDELLAQEPAEFRKLSARWRLLHPRDERGNLSQNDAARGINAVLYGDKKSDSLRPVAGTREAFRDAAQIVGGSEQTGRPPQEQANALRTYAQENGLAFSRLPRRFSQGSENDKGGMEHHVWFDDKSGRWVKATSGNGAGMGLQPRLTPDGWEMKRGTVKEYLESRDLWNKVFGDDIRLHGVQDDGRNISVVTSQPDITGSPMTAHEISKAMESAGFTAMGDSVYYRKRDNVAVFDLHEGNAVNADGAMIPFDGVILHPSEDLLDVLKFEKATGKSKMPIDETAPKKNFMEAARQRLEMAR
jgi:hypothetical protein